MNKVIKSVLDEKLAVIKNQSINAKRYDTQQLK